MRNAQELMTERPHIAICSLFRNRSAHIKACFERRKQLAYPQDLLTHICIEGDSEDNTFELLQREAACHKNMIVKKLDANMPAMWGFIHPARLKALADSANLAIEVAAMQTNAEYVLWLESDLEYPLDIIERLMRWKKAVVAPMVFIKGSEMFYDIWAFRQGVDSERKGPEGAGGCFRANAPYHPAYQSDQIFQVDSAGSVLFIKTEVIRKGGHFTNDEVIVGFCKSSRSLGYEVWVDPSTIVWHPIPKHMEQDGSRLRAFEPWHEGKVCSKFQEKVPIDSVAYNFGKRLGYGRHLEYAWVAKRLLRKQEASVLDFGCGESEFSVYMAWSGLHVTAVDREDFSAVHSEYKDKHGVKYCFLQEDGCKLRFPDAHFDQITAISSVEHAQNDREVMRELSRVCKPKGKIFLTVPYDHYVFWWDSDRPDLGIYYYNFQALLERFICPLKLKIRDFSFMRYYLPDQGSPFFSHPNNGGIIVLELENKREEI